MQFFNVQDGANPAVILDFLNLKFLVVSGVGKANTHQCTKFHQNQSNDCRIIAFNAFNGFQNGSQPMILNFLNLYF